MHTANQVKVCPLQFTTSQNDSKFYANNCWIFRADSNSTGDEIAHSVGVCTVNVTNRPDKRPDDFPVVQWRVQQFLPSIDTHLSAAYGWRNYWPRCWSVAPVKFTKISHKIQFFSFWMQFKFQNELCSSNACKLTPEMCYNWLACRFF